MTVRPVLQIGHPTLRERAREITEAERTSAEVRALVEDLVDTMRANQGAGIAANQIGVPLRVAVIEVNENARYPYKPEIPLTVIINPVIEPLDDEMVVINEGCLSVPLRGDVPRHVNVRVRYLDGDGTPHDEVKRGLTAGTWQHECDHLDGVLFVDRVEDSRSLSTWDEFDQHHRDTFIARITAFVDDVGS